MKKNRSQFLWTLGVSALNSLLNFFIFQFFFNAVVGVVLAIIAFVLLIWVMAGMQASKIEEEKKD